MKQLTLIIALAIAGLASFAAETYQLSDKQGKVEFHAKGKPAFISITGTGKGLEGKLEEKNGKLNGTIEFNLESFDTGIGLRNEHMKENYLETEKYPKAFLHIKDLAIPSEWGKSFPFEGMMEIKGKKNPVKGTAKVISAGGVLKIDAEFPLKISDYDIGVPSYKGITVAEDVKVNVAAEATKVPVATQAKKE